jgi:hypothetical protein
MKIYPYGILTPIEEIIAINKHSDIAEMIELLPDDTETAMAAAGLKDLLDAKLSLFLGKFGEFIRSIDSNLETNEDTKVFKEWVKENFKG